MDEETFEIASKSPAKLINLMRVLLAAKYDLIDVGFEGPASAPTKFKATFAVDNTSGDMTEEDVANLIQQLRQVRQTADAIVPGQP